MAKSRKGFVGRATNWTQFEPSRHNRYAYADCEISFGDTTHKFFDLQTFKRRSGAALEIRFIRRPENREAGGQILRVQIWDTSTLKSLARWSRFVLSERGLRPRRPSAGSSDD